MARLKIAPAALERVVLLTAALRTLKPLKDEEVFRRREEFLQSRRLSLGADVRTWRAPPMQAEPKFFTDDLAEFRAFIRKIDNDLAEQVRIVAANVAHHYRTGMDIPPYFVRRIAVILRKAKQWDLEVSFLDEWVRLFCDANEWADDWPIARAEKARVLAVRASRISMVPKLAARPAPSLTPVDVSLAWEFIGEMQRLRPPSESEIVQRSARWYSEHPLWEVFSRIELPTEGGEAAATPVIIARPSIDSLPAQLRLAAEGMEHFVLNGVTPLYLPPQRVAILLRRDRLFACEASFCEAWARLCADAPHAHPEWFVRRASAAIALAKSTLS